MGWGHSVIMAGRVSLNRKVSRGLVIDCIKEPEHAVIRAARQGEYIYMYACMCFSAIINGTFFHSEK